MKRQEELFEILSTSAWFMDLLRAARAVNPPEWWIGAGAVRDLVWDIRFGLGFDASKIKDVDLAFFHPDDLSEELEDRVESELSKLVPSAPWDAKNQAAVHKWYPQVFGIDVEPLASAAAGVATWPETATAVGVRLRDGGLEVTAEFGLDDLLDGVYRINPVRVTLEEYQRRLAAKNVATRWPGVKVIRT